MASPQTSARILPKAVFLLAVAGCLLAQDGNWSYHAAADSQGEMRNDEIWTNAVVPSSPAYQLGVTCDDTVYVSVLVRSDAVITSAARLERPVRRRRFGSPSDPVQPGDLEKLRLRARRRRSCPDPREPEDGFLAGEQRSSGDVRAVRHRRARFGDQANAAQVPAAARGASGGGETRAEAGESFSQDFLREPGAGARH